MSVIYFTALTFKVSNEEHKRNFLINWLTNYCVNKKVELVEELIDSHPVKEVVQLAKDWYIDFHIDEDDNLQINTNYKGYNDIAIELYHKLREYCDGGIVAEFYSDMHPKPDWSIDLDGKLETDDEWNKFENYNKKLPYKNNDLPF